MNIIKCTKTVVGKEHGGKIIINMCNHDKSCSGYEKENQYKRCCYEDVSGRCLHTAVSGDIHVSIKVMDEEACIFVPDIGLLFGNTSNIKGTFHDYTKIGEAGYFDAIAEKGPLQPSVLEELKKRCKKISIEEVYKGLAKNWRYEKRFEDLDCTLTIDLRE